MKAISIKQPWASLIATGRKTIEVRSWATPHRGPLLVVASRRPVFRELPTGQAIAVVELVDCRPMAGGDESAAHCAHVAGAWAWVLANARPIKPFAVQGRLRLFEVSFPVGDEPGVCGPGCESRECSS